MITEILSLVAYLIENCTGVALIQKAGNSSVQSADSHLVDEVSDPLEDFTEFDEDDTIFQEHDPPQHLVDDPKAWKQSLPAFSKSFWECLKTVLVIQAVSGTLIGMVAVGIVFLDFSTATWCYEDTPHWNVMPKSVQRLRIAVESVEGFIIQFWVFCVCCTVFPRSLIQKLNLLTITLVAAFLDTIYRLNLQLFGAYQVKWRSFPLNALFLGVVVLCHSRLARHFHPRSWRNALRLFLSFSAQYIFGISIAFVLFYVLFPFYIDQRDDVKLFIASLSPLITTIPKLICRLGAQLSFKEEFHPGSVHVQFVALYGGYAAVFRVMQAELTSIDLFILLGIIHAIIDLLERLTITMRDHIWEYLYRLVRRQRSRPPKYRSPRSRRLIADASIQIMMQETSALITALGFVYTYQLLYHSSTPFTDYQVIIKDFLIRAIIGISIDLFFNVISLLIQTRVMNIAVSRVWKKKWRHHIVVNCIVVWFSVLYCCNYVYVVVRNKYDATTYSGAHHIYNCSFPSFL